MYRREYGRANKLLNSEMTPKESACNFAQLLMGEIKDLCHLDSIFHNTSSAIHNFSWGIVWNELQSKTPTLLQFYRHMFLASLKWRSDGMGLVQRVISCLMYGNGCSKQVRISCDVNNYILCV